MRSLDGPLALSALFCLVFASSMCLGQVLTDQCPWPSFYGDQGRGRTGWAPGPRSPGVLFSISFAADRDWDWGPHLGGISSGDSIIITCIHRGRDEDVLLAGCDGRTLNRKSGSVSAAAVSNNMCYFMHRDSNDNLSLLCWAYDWSELWRASCIEGSAVPVAGRGIAVADEFGYPVTLQFFDTDGQLISEDTDVLGRPAFGPDGTAAWVEDRLEGDPFGWHDYVYRARSEAAREGVEFTGGLGDIRWCASYTKVNDLGHVLVAADKKVVVFEDVNLARVLSEHEVEGYVVWEGACADPSGVWYVVHATRRDETDEMQQVMLERIEPDGSISFDIRLQRPTGIYGYDYYYPICDANGDVYISFDDGRLASYDHTGNRRWSLDLSGNEVELLGADSRGVLYASERVGTPPKLFAIGDGEPQHSRVRVKLPDRAARNAYSPGDELVVLLQPYNFGEDEVVDGYLAVVLPNGAISFYTASGWSASPTPWFPGVFLPNSFEMIDAPVSLGVIPEGAPEGTYTIIAGFTTPGTLTPVDELFPISFQVAR